MRTVYAMDAGWKRKTAEAEEQTYSLPLQTALLQPEEPAELYRVFSVPDGDNIGDFFLILEHLTAAFDVLIDGKFVAHAESLFAPVCIDISAYVVKGQQQTLSLQLQPAAAPDSAFTFGSAKIIGTHKSHFDLTVPGASPLSVQTSFTDEGVTVTVDAALVNPNNYDIVIYRLVDPAGKTVGIRTERPTAPTTVFTLPKPMLWDGVHAAYKYRLEAVLKRDAAVLDVAELSFGIRKAQLDPSGLFRLNGLKIPLGGVALLPAPADSTEMELLHTLDANCVKIFTLYPDEKLLDLCDTLGIIVFFTFSVDTADRETELAGTIKLLQSHPSVCFLCCDTRDLSLLKQFTDTVHKYAPEMLTVGGCDILDEESLSDAVPDLLLLKISETDGSAEVLELETKVTAALKAHPDYRFAVFADAPDALAQTEDAGAAFSVWHEKIWRIFYNKKNVVAYFAGYLTDGDTPDATPGLVCADHDGIKDAFWFYRTQFSADGFVKLCAPEHTSTTRKLIDIKCYTNTPPIRLTVNGKQKKKYKCDAISDSVYVFRNIKLRKRNNTIVISTSAGTDSEVIYRLRRAHGTQTE